MTDAGLHFIEVSKANGLWDYWADVDVLIVPDDLCAALDALPLAVESFDKNTSTYRRNLLRWVKLAKTSPTRAKPIAQIVDFVAWNGKIPQM